MMRRPGRRILPPFFALLSLVLLPHLSGASIPSMRLSGAPAARLPSPDGIRVLLEESAVAMEIRGFDLRLHEVRAARGKLEPELVRIPHPDRSTSIRVRCVGGRVIVEAAHRRDLSVNALQVDTPAGMFRLRSRFLRDTLRIYPGDREGVCQAVNELEIEKYLDGLVNSEFSAAWNESAIEAQVIAARTYASHQMRRARLQGARFDVHGSVKDQVYEGSHQEDSRAARAVQRTRGQILVARDARQEPIKAYYHSTCGGATELPERVWGARSSAFKKTVSCPYCSSSPRFNWTLDLREEELRTAVAKGALAQTPRGWPRDWKARLERGGIRGVKSLENPGRALAGSRLKRAERLEITLGDGTPLRLAASQFRDWLGTTRLRSTAFTVDRRKLAGSAGVFHFSGRGNGHGVGLCQWGAKVMGDQGFDREAILRFYYPDAIVAKLW